MKFPSAKLGLLGVAVVVFTGCSDGEAPTSEGTEPQPEVRSITQGQKVTVSQGTNMALAISPDGNRISISLQGVLFTLPVAGGSAEPITDEYHDAREPAYSPDGQHIVFHGYRDGNWDLFEVSAAGGPTRALTSDEFDDREPAYSPDGTRVAFSSDRDGNYDIWLLNLDSSTLQQVTHQAGDEHSPAWSPDGTRLAFSANVARAASELWVAGVDSDVSEMIAAESAAISGVAWQPGGNGIAYQILDRTGQPRAELKYLDLASGERRTLSSPGDDVFPFRPAWVDDGTLLYTANGEIQRRFLSGTAATSQIPFNATFVLDRPSYPRRLRDHDNVASRRALGIVSPAISADGNLVTFTALGDLWLHDLTDESLQNLTDDPHAEQLPRFSPDGNSIAYISERSGTAGLWIYDLPQQQHRQVPVQISGPSNPTWSPDGSSIALFTSVPGNPTVGQLIVTELADGSVTPIGKPVPPQPVSWNPDGTYLATTVLAPYSGRYREGVYQLTVTNLSNGSSVAVEPVPHKNITDAALTPHGQAMTYVQEGLLWQQNLDEEFRPTGHPTQMTDELTDNPSWSPGGNFLVYLNADRLIRLDPETGETRDISPPLLWHPDPPTRTWTLRVGRLFDGVNPDYQRNVDITVTGNRITDIRPADPSVFVDVDASDRTAIPGLFEMHAHMGPTSEIQGRTWLAFGITSVRDPGSNPYVAKERQEMWDSGRSDGPRTHVTGYLADGNRVYYSVAEGISSDEHLERALSRSEKLQLDFIKTYVRLPDHRQKRVVEFAHGIGIPVSSHELYPAVAHGMDHVEHIGGTSRRGYTPKVSALGHSYDDVISLLVESGMGITPTAVLPGYSVIINDDEDYFSSPQFKAFYGESARAAATALARMFGRGAGATAEANGQLLQTLADADAQMVTGTDSPFVPYGAGLHAELRLYQRAGLSGYQILRSATYKSATAAGVAEDLGSLEVGKLADLVLLDGDPLADIRDADNVVMTVKNGRMFPLEQLVNPSR